MHQYLFHGITNNNTITVDGLKEGETWQYSTDGGATYHHHHHHHYHYFQQPQRLQPQQWLRFLHLKR
jgi:hypothetical protein